MVQIRKSCYVLLLLVIIVFLASCTKLSISTTPIAEETEKVIPEEIKEEAFHPPVKISLVAVGDIMVHGPQLRAQYNPEIGEHDFTNNFQFIKPYIQEADLAIANLETTFGGKEKGYSSFPMFNSPDALADALKETGFHVISTANNHTIDTGKKGMIRTIEVIKDRGLEVIGTRKEENIKNYIIKDIKDIKFGLTAYTYETPIYGQYRTLNGIKIPKEIEGLINSFSYETLEEDLLRMKETVDMMKNAGAEIIIFYLHWGEEYQRRPNPYQRTIAEKLKGYGVDILFGSHPHVLQPIEFLESEKDSSKTLVVYSMGNFLSNQRYEILENRYTEDGIIINVKIKKDFEKKEVTIEEVSYVPTWVYRYYPKGKAVYEIIPVMDALENHIEYSINNNETIWRIDHSKNNTLQLMESSNVSAYQRSTLSKRNKIP